MTYSLSYPQSRDAIASKKNKQMFRRCAKVIRIVVVVNLLTIISIFKGRKNFPFKKGLV